MLFPSIYDYLEFPEYQRILAIILKAIPFHRRFHLMKASGVIKFVCFFFVTAGFADDPRTVSLEPPAWMKDVTRLPPGTHLNKRSVKLGYTLDWNHQVNAGAVEIAIVRDSPEGSKLVGEASGSSTGFARALWPYQFTARSIVDQSSLRPVTFQLNERDRDAENSYDIIFERYRQIFTTTSKKKEEILSSTDRFKFDFGQDVLSSAFYLRSQALNEGDEISMVVTPFNRPYLATFEVLGRETHKVKGTVYAAIKVDARIGKVNPDLTINTYDKIKKTTLWLSDDEFRIPLELQSQIAFGFVSARLDEIEWLE